MQSTSEFKGADLTLEWEQNGEYYTMKSKVDAILDHEEEYEFYYDDFSYDRTMFPTHTSTTFKIQPQEDGKIATVVKEKKLVEFRSVAILIPSLTQANINAAVKQADMGDIEFEVEKVDDGYLIKFNTDNTEGV